MVELPIPCQLEDDYYERGDDAFAHGRVGLNGPFCEKTKSLVLKTSKDI